MESKFEEGTRVYIVENNIHVRECTVMRRTGDFYVIALTGEGGIGNGMIRLRGSRLFATKTEAERMLPSWRRQDMQSDRRVRRRRSPYDFDH